MDLTALLQNPLVENTNVHFNAKDVYNFQLEKTPDMRILMKKFKKSFDSAEPKPSTVTLDVGNTDRAFGTIIGSEITARSATRCPTTRSMSSATATAARASARSSPRA